MRYRKFRVREEIFRVILFIEWKLLLEGRTREEIKHISDEIINYSLSKIKKNNIKIKTSNYGKERESIGFTLRETTLKLLIESHEKLNLYAGELIEVCVYLYFIEHFTEEDLTINKLQNWGIKFGNY